MFFMLATARIFWTGGLGNDQLFGGKGADTFLILEQNPGNDHFHGGLGVDTIEFGDAWGLGYSFVAINRLILDVKASIERMDVSSGLGIWGTAGADVFNLSGITTYLTGASGIDGGEFHLLGNTDWFLGGSQAELVYGGGSADTLIGGGGNDSLYGGSSADLLTGGDGQDSFVFDTLLDPSNIDQITDVTPGTDRVELASAPGFPFEALVAGALPAAAFKVLGLGNGAQEDLSDRILLDVTTGTLSYDPDGKGGVAAQVFAQVTAHLVLSAADFSVI
jgi:Ca2+-binding RTX toxin-like protein